jgi:hypothetical protein
MDRLTRAGAEDQIVLAGSQQVGEAAAAALENLGGPHAEAVEAGRVPPG